MKMIAIDAWSCHEGQRSHVSCPRQGYVKKAPKAAVERRARGGPSHRTPPAGVVCRRAGAAGVHLPETFVRTHICGALDVRADALLVADPDSAGERRPAGNGGGHLRPAKRI